jgi:uncharacterized membrane protein SirB2
MDYFTLKAIHQGAVALSFAGFFVRGCAALVDAPWVRGRLARTLPHVVDTVLLASAIALAWRLRLDPSATPWLAAKIVALPAYIVLGAVALRPGRRRAVRATAWVAALITFAYIVCVAISKSPLGFTAALHF